MKNSEMANMIVKDIKSFEGDFSFNNWIKNTKVEYLQEIQKRGNLHTAQGARFLGPIIFAVLEREGYVHSEEIKREDIAERMQERGFHMVFSAVCELKFRDGKMELFEQSGTLRDLDGEYKGVDLKEKNVDLSLGKARKLIDNLH